jgi:iron complex transport system substrate-binding protein
MIDRGYPKLMQRLEKSGITVVSLQPGTVPQLKTYWRILGQLGGRKVSAEKMITAFDRAVAAFKALSESVKPKRVYFEAIHRKMKTFTPASMAIFVLETAGGVNVAADARAVHGTNIAAYGKERILSHADEIDVYLSQKGPMNRVTMDSITREPGFAVIRAVKQGQVYIIEESIVSRPTTRLLLGINRIGRILYPQCFAGCGAQLLKQTGFFKTK